MLLVIIHNLHVVGIAIAPDKTNAPLVIDADAVLAFPVTFQGFQMIAGRRPQIAKFGRDIQLPQFSLSDALKSQKSFDGSPVMNLLGLSRPEGLDHPSAYNAKR